LSSLPEKKPLGLTAATAVVVANMIGVGVFSSLSFQVFDLNDGNHPLAFSIMLLWLIGGIAALLGALSYSELGAALPRSGGEYNFLSRIYHPAVGFLSGWVSIVVGFAAPIAAAAFALGAYLVKVFPDSNPTVIACIAVVGLSFAQSFSVRAGGVMQSVFTILKLGLILSLIFAGLAASEHQNISLNPQALDWTKIFSNGFAVSMVYVSFAYSGWNAAAYIAGEIDNPKKNLPRALITGTLIVTVLYLLLNFVFLYTVPLDEMLTKGEIFDANTSSVVNKELAVGFLAGKHIFGPSGAQIVAAFVVIGLLSTISAMVIAGPRVTASMGEDFSIFRFLSKKGPGGAPVYSIALQMGISIGLILTASFDWVMNYIGFTLAIFSSLTVLGVFVLRVREPNLERPYRTWGYPVTPFLFLLINFWMIYFLVTNYKEGATLQVWQAGLITIGSGLLVYFVVNALSEKKSDIPKQE
jgi:basic amino acid/polyamine antiporter, APA family